MTRKTSYGEAGGLTLVDRLGVWLSARQMRRWVPSFRGLHVADLGCGHDARFARTLVGEARSILLADVSLAPDLAAMPGVVTRTGPLEETLPTLADGSLDVVLCISVLEHLWEPEAALRHVHRALAPGGTFLVNVPSWAGKRALEASAFQLGTSPREEMNDHKMYYDVRDLWPLLVRAGFVPEDIRCFSHKLGLNTFAACRKAANVASR